MPDPLGPTNATRLAPGAARSSSHARGRSSASPIAEADSLQIDDRTHGPAHRIPGYTPESVMTRTPMSAPPRRAPRRRLFLALVAGARARPSSDAIVRTRAMSARPPSPRYFVEPKSASVVELEIGEADVPAFRRSAARTSSTPSCSASRPSPLAERVTRLPGRGTCRSSAGDGPTGSPGTAGVGAGPRERLPRDEVSGEVRSSRPARTRPRSWCSSSSSNTRLVGRPERARPPRRSAGTQPVAMGFVVYHGGVAVNDFRYLALSPRCSTSTGSDPWYSPLRPAGALRRQYFAPMSGFLYVEPYEVRKEIIVPPPRAAALGRSGAGRRRTTIAPEIQPELLRRRRPSSCAGTTRVEIDGRASSPPSSRRIHFLERSLRTSRGDRSAPRAPRRPRRDARRAIFVYPTDGLPQRVTLDWDLWHDSASSSIPAATVDQAGPLPYLSSSPTARRSSSLGELPEESRAAHAAWRWRTPPSPRGSGPSAGPACRWALCAVAVGVGRSWPLARRRRSLALPAARTGRRAGLMAFCPRAAAGPPLRRPRRRAWWVDLLHNVYRAFDFRDEEAHLRHPCPQRGQGDLLEQHLPGDPPRPRARRARGGRARKREGASSPR